MAALPHSEVRSHDELVDYGIRAGAATDRQPQRVARRLTCPKPSCNHWLILTNVELGPGEFIQAHCPKCKKERRFTA